jgi:hypothetical protein
MFRLKILVSLSLIAFTGTLLGIVLSCRSAATPLLRWPPPPLDNPMALRPPAYDTRWTNGITQYDLDPDKDYIIELPNEKKVGGLIIEGGRNVQVIGGYITANPEHSIDNTDWTNRAVYVKNNRGTVHIEGLLIDGSSSGQHDGIAISSPNSIVQVENVRIVGLQGRYDQVHADIIETDGGFKELRLDRLTGTSNYQGLFFSGRGPTIVQNIDVGYQASPYVADYKTGQFLWITAGSTTCASEEHTFSDLYVQPKPGLTLGDSVWPTVDNPPGCTANVANNEATWPDLPVTGSVKLGPPLGGNFVPADTVGLGYISPGYQ